MFRYLAFIMMPFASMMLFASTSANAETVSLSNALDGLSRISFGTESNLAIGDTIDVADPTEPKERCIGYKNTDIKADTKGALSARLSFKFIRNIDQFENTFNFSYNVQAASSANFAKVIGGGSTLTSFGSFENFVKRNSDSVLILIDAYADHGREMIQDFALKQPYQKMIDEGRYSDFRAACGTHFIRGWTRRSAITVVIEVSNLSQQAKFALENTMSAAANATIGIKDFSGTARASTTTALKDTLKLASKLGRVSARVETIGGKGIATIAALVGAGNLTVPENIDKLLSKLADAAKDFSVENSAPQQFIVVPNPGLTGANIAFNAQNFEKLGSIYRALVRVDQRLQLYDEYRARDVKLWNSYFRPIAEKIKALRASLIEAYRDCKTAGKCDAKVPNHIDGVILEDVLWAGKLEARCIYAYEYTDVLNGREMDKFNYLSSIAIVWTSEIRFLKEIDPLSTELKIITPEFELIRPAFDPQRHQSLKTYASGDDGEIFVDAYRQRVDRNKVLVGKDIKIDVIRDVRKRAAQSLYVLTFHTYSGLEVEAVLGRPEMRKCPVYIQEK